MICRHCRPGARKCDTIPNRPSIVFDTPNDFYAAVTTTYSVVNTPAITYMMFSHCMSTLGTLNSRQACVTPETSHCGSHGASQNNVDADCTYDVVNVASRERKDSCDYKRQHHSHFSCLVERQKQRAEAPHRHPIATADVQVIHSSAAPPLFFPPSSFLLPSSSFVPPPPRFLPPRLQIMPV